MGKIEVILTNCIKDIKSGRASMAECLDRYPSLRRELEPLLKMALNIKEPSMPVMGAGDKQALKDRLMAEIKEHKQQKPAPSRGIFSFGLPPQFAWARVAASVIIVVIILSILAGGTAYASQSSIPGDLLYPVKIGTENARLLLAGDSYDKAELNLQFAQIRLEEMSKLGTGEEENTQRALNGYRGNLNSAREHAGTLTDDSELSLLLNTSLEDMQDQITYCDNIMDAGPGNPDPVREACSLNVGAQLEFIRMLEQHNNVQAAQSNLNAMQNRLQRARDKAADSQYQLMEEALEQYRQFNELGEEILESAQSTNNHDDEVEMLNRERLSDYLDTLDNIAEETPQEYQNAIEESRQRTSEAHMKARHNNGQQGREEPDENSQLNPDSGNRPDHEQGNEGNSQPHRENSSNDETPTATPTPSSESGAGTGNGNQTDSDTNPGGDDQGGPIESSHPSPDNNGNAEGDTGNSPNGNTDNSGVDGGDPPSSRGNPPPEAGPKP